MENGGVDCYHPPVSSRALLCGVHVLRLWRIQAFLRDAIFVNHGMSQVNVARDVAVQMCDTLEGKAYTGVVNVSYMAVANEVRGDPASLVARIFRAPFVFSSRRATIRVAMVLHVDLRPSPCPKCHSEQ